MKHSYTEPQMLLIAFGPDDILTAMNSGQTGDVCADDIFGGLDF